MKTMTITFTARNAAKIAARLQDLAEAQPVGSKGWCALGGLASAISDSTDGTVKIDRHDARFAHPHIGESLDRVKTDGGPVGPEEDLFKIVLQIQDAFSILFKIEGPDGTRTLTVGDGSNLHRTLAYIALDLTGLSDLWNAPPGAEVALDLSEVAPRARKDETRALIATMDGNVSGGLEDVRAALAKLDENSATHRASISLA